MNPIEIIYSWQALLVACAATGLTQLTKVIIDIGRGHRHAVPTPTVRDMAKVGKELRESREELFNRVLNRLILPGLPIVYGTACACIVPARPEVIIEYAATHEIAGAGLYLLFAAWGAACGQFADYLFSKAKGAMEVFARSGGSSSSSSKPPEADEKDEENAG
jgi:hypothetical protein